MVPTLAREFNFRSPRIESGAQSNTVAFLPFSQSPFPLAGAEPSPRP
jgi:hypothetical protein